MGSSDDDDVVVVSFVNNESYSENNPAIYYI